ncbi:hypothetical protein EDWATA_02043 [Edwardsiella tarda ATCC 23685]|uniref:Uncharacterized protein n=1 Tax=Edwardsiella tarda ATCC 23685 TaxID=500638 RepID=D4F5L5_EDWTA|nr:hypothetical protein EDWATA_02043 [Edwardsiella tarda ATCC 23685]
MRYPSYGYLTKFPQALMSNKVTFTLFIMLIGYQNLLPIMSTPGASVETLWCEAIKSCIYSRLTRSRSGAS